MSTASRYAFVVVGAGIAGIAAAIEAAERGLRVLVVEAFSEYGGTAATSGAGMCIVNTPLQRDRGITDSVELAFADWLAVGGEEADRDWAHRYLERSCGDLFRWLARRGVEWQEIGQPEGNSVPRWHQPKGAGAEVMRLLYEGACRLPIEWRFTTTVTRLAVEREAVVGVEVDSEDGRQSVAARRVLLATGGFANNLEMLRASAPNVATNARLLCGGGAQALGRGHHLVEQVGAEFVGIDRIWIYPYGTVDYRDPSGSRGLAIRGLSNEIWVNAQGRRFHAEDKQGGASGTPALLAQSPPTAWAIFTGEQATRLMIADPYYVSHAAPDRERIERFLAESPYVHRADSPAELAEAAGLPAAALVATLDEVNAWARDGARADPQFGRNLDGFRAIDAPPFFAIQYFPLARKCLGGVRTDGSCRVIRSDGSSIAGLYAAGELAGMAGGHINGRAALEGTMVGPSLFSGRIAGRVAASANG